MPDTSRMAPRWAALATGLIFAGASAVVHAQTSKQAPAWPLEAWNPKPMADDLILPLPCGGAIAFRPVPTPMSPGVLSDRQTVLGWSNPETDYSEFVHRSFIAGGFPGSTTDAPRQYYLAKYEVSVDQYAAVTGPDCGSLPTANGRMPKANVAWHDAATFTVRLSSWLLKHARDALPKEGEALAFVRLPTEDEWEYAARGGSKVSDVDFLAPTFPMPDGMQRYVWFQGTRSAGGAAHAIGQLEPNPLGLFDILGNVSEWTIEPYRLDKVGRPHGLAGSATARGGDFLTPEQRIRTAQRREVPALNGTTGEPTSQSNIGFRPVLARLTTTSDGEVQAMQQAFAKEAQSNASAAGNPLELLELLRRDVLDDKVKSGLQQIEATLQTTNRELKEKDALVLRGILKTAAHAARQIVVQKAVEEATTVFGKAQMDAVTVQEELIASQETLANATRDEAVRQALRVQESRMREAAKSYQMIQKKMSEYAVRTSADTLSSLKAEYLRIVTMAAGSADPETLEREGKVVTQEFEPLSRGGFLVAFTKVAVTHMKAVRAGKTPTADQAEADLMAAANALQRPPPPR
jgi:formylglycine-generating enzyme required for sulfatase activity